MTKIWVFMLIAILSSSVGCLRVSQENHDFDLFGWVGGLFDGGDDGQG